MEKGEVGNRRKHWLNTNPTARRKLFAEKGYRCVGCGKTEGHMVLHHVVPISKGGLDDPSNIVVLCERCHDKVHDLSLDGSRKPFANFTGRPRTCTSEDEEKYYSQYINCEIGAKELKEKLGIKSGSKIKDRPGFKEFLERHHIKEYKNSIDLRTARKPKLIDGEWIGRVVFEDGTEQRFYHSETNGTVLETTVV